MSSTTLFIFDNKELNTVMRSNDPWFWADDVCAILDLKNPRDAIAKLDDDEKDVVLTDTLGGRQNKAVISESGLYTLTLRCRDAMKAGTKPHWFRKWITSEVIPAIRKTGGYMVAAPEETPEELALRAMSVLQATVERQKAQLAITQPKATAHDRIADADGSLNLTETAKALQIPPRTLTDWLNRNGWIYKRAGAAHWLGYQERVKSGYLTHKVSTVTRPDGSEKITEQVRVTPKGLTRLASLISL